MARTDDYLRALLDQAAAEEAFFGNLGQANDAQSSASATAPAPAPVVSLMITNQQRAELRERGFAEEAIRQMTPTEAHEHLGLTTPNP
jgi:hypothetical protein